MCDETKWTEAHVIEAYRKGLNDMMSLASRAISAGVMARIDEGGYRMNRQIEAILNVVRMTNPHRMYFGLMFASVDPNQDEETQEVVRRYEARTSKEWEGDLTCVRIMAHTVDDEYLWHTYDWGVGINAEEAVNHLYTKFCNAFGVADE